MASFQKLTRPSIKKLAPGKRVTEHGITFERQPNGDGIYSVNIMVDRIRIHRVIGRESDGTTRSQCETFIESRARLLARTDLPCRREGKSPSHLLTRQTGTSRS